MRCARFEGLRVGSWGIGRLWVLGMTIGIGWLLGVRLWVIMGGRSEGWRNQGLDDWDLAGVNE